MALDTSTPRSRRAILAAAAGAAAATVVGAVTRPSLTRAAGDDGSIVHIGDFYANALSQTTWSNQSNDEIVLWVASNPDSGGGGGTAVVGYSDHGIGVQGQSNNTGVGVHGVSSGSTGVHGASSSYFGVYAESDSYIGIYGLSNSHTGVVGFSTATSQPASIGWANAGSTGVQGVSGASAPPAKAKTGVYGYAAQDNFSRGVTGESPAGIGLYGISNSGYGVYSAGRVYTTKYYEMGEITNPAAPILNRARLFIRDNGLGKTQLCVRFHTGSVKVLSTES
jgi:hypothetical protein